MCLRRQRRGTWLPFPPSCFLLSLSLSPSPFLLLHQSLLHNSSTIPLRYLSLLCRLLVHMSSEMISRFEDEDDFTVELPFDNQKGCFDLYVRYWPVQHMTFASGPVRMFSCWPAVTDLIATGDPTGSLHLMTHVHLLNVITHPHIHTHPHHSQH